MEFSPELRPAVLSGDVTLTVRLWSRPQVRVGNRYRIRGGEIQVESIELVPFAVIDADDLARTGEPDLETLRRRTAHAGPVRNDTLVYRVAFRVV